MNRTMGQVRSQPKGRGARLWLIAAVSALLLLAVGRAPVSAAPMLTAEANPVSIPSPAMTATTKLKWSGIPAPPKAKVALYIDGALKVAAPVTETGGYMMTVHVGNNFVELRDAVTMIPVAKLTVVGKETAAVCPKQGCIKEVAVTPHGTFAGFNVPTAAEAKLHIEVGTQPPTPANTFANVVSAADSPNGTTHQVDLLNLKPNTLYHFVVRAEDLGGFKYYRTGTFTTLKQKIDVTFTQIHILDDSDNATGGDLKFWFYIQGNGALVWQYPDDAVDTGDNLAIALSGSVLNTSGVLDLRVNGFDDDDDFGGGLCSNGTATPPLGSGSNDCADWIEKTWQNLSMTKSGPGEVYTAAFSITAAEYGVPLAFTVSGTYTVSYF